MLVRFYTDEEDLKYYGELPSGDVRNMGGPLRPGYSLGNLSYGRLAALRNGVIDWNNDTKIGTILPPDDPRNITAPYPS